MLTIVLSGPKSSRPAVERALAGNGFELRGDLDEQWHGLANSSDGKKPKAPVGFVTVDGDDIDLSHQLVESLGWRLRHHMFKPDPVEPVPDPLDELRREIAELKAKVNA